MISFEAGLRELVVEVVRDEVRRALASLTVPDEYLSTREAGKVASVAQGTIRRWIREGKLEPHKAGRMVRVRRADLERLLVHEGPRDREESPEAWARRTFG